MDAMLGSIWAVFVETEGSKEEGWASGDCQSQGWEACRSLGVRCPSIWALAVDDATPLPCHVERDLVHGCFKAQAAEAERSM